MKKLILASLLILIISCKETAKETVSFKSYDDAINYTESHSYKINYPEASLEVLVNPIT